MILPRNKRRLFLGAGGLILATLTMLLLARLKFTGLAVSALLQLGGASEINLSVTQASPWRVVVADLRFQVRTQVFSARRVTISRRHWWTPSLGVVQVEQARVAVTVDGSDINAINWATYQNSRAKVQPWQVPLDELAVDGQLVVQAAALPAQVLTGKIAARLSPQKNWEFRAQAGGPGLAMQTEGSYNVAKDDLIFKVPDMALDLKIWQGFLQRLILLPGGPWELEGQLTGRAEGRRLGKQFTATGAVRWREGRAANRQRAILGEGIEAGLEFSDLAQISTRPGNLRIREVRTGQLVLRGLEAELALSGANKIAVSHASFQTLGGTVVVEPFDYFPGLRELETVVRVGGISIAEVMALTQDLPALVTGRLNGRCPIRIDDGGLRFGPGSLELTPGVPARLQLTTGDRRKLRLTELRLAIRPPGAPPGCSAQLHIAGVPDDGVGNAPIVLDINVTGPLERYLHLDLESPPK